MIFFSDEFIIAMLGNHICNILPVCEAVSPSKYPVSLQAVADLTSDAGYVIPSMQFVQAIAEKCPVYLYVFDHYPEVTRVCFWGKIAW